MRIYSASDQRAKLRGAGLEPRDTQHAHGIHAPYWWLRCAVGPSNDEHRLVRAYHQVLVWDIGGTQPWRRFTRLADRVLTPVIGKSIVIYAHKPVATAPPGEAAA